MLYSQAEGDLSWYEVYEAVTAWMHWLCLGCLRCIWYMSEMLECEICQDTAWPYSPAALKILITVCGLSRWWGWTAKVEEGWTRSSRVHYVTLSFTRKHVQQLPRTDPQKKVYKPHTSVLFPQNILEQDLFTETDRVSHFYKCRIFISTRWLPRSLVIPRTWLCASWASRTFGEVIRRAFQSRSKNLPASWASVWWIFFLTTPL